MKIEELKAYRITEKCRIEELNSDAVILEHIKTRARVFLLENDDENKVFAIGFRTPPSDSTGVPHIIEHSVLCGSAKYPAKDPFIELAKGSLNTFLNAMTYPDKTVYPVASCNDKDFENLTDVYLDAVFHPNIYRNEKIFMQEGWHYELDEETGELFYNGVVYNEMKGVYSSLDGVMEHAIFGTLFEGNTYQEESGGAPDAIPELTYQAFLDFHKKYYHPSNSYIYLYGNADMAGMLDRIDREYLSEYDYEPIESEIPVLPAWEAPRETSCEYSVSEEESVRNKTALTLNTVVGGELDPVRYTAFQLLEYVLLDVPGAPLREALINAGIGDDISGGYCPGIRQPYFSVIAKNTEAEKKDDFLRIVREVLTDLAENGIDHDSLMAAINVSEFRAREADFGSYPKGLMVGLQCFDSWLYDENPGMHLKYDSVFSLLKEKAGTGYFEELIRESLLENPYSAVIIFRPVKGLTERKETELKNRMQQLKDSFGTDRIEEIKRKTEELKKYQSEPSPAEILEKIPLLKRSDLKRECEKLGWKEENINGIRVIRSSLFTSGIVYLKWLFDLQGIAPEDIPYVSFLCELFGYIDTEKHTYPELSKLIDLNSGGIGFSSEAYPDVLDSEKTMLTFSANAKVLAGKTGFASGMVSEILFSSCLKDRKRLQEVLAEVRSKVREGIQYSGHQTALNRAGAMSCTTRFFNDMTKGIGFYKMLEDLKVTEELSDRLERICTEYLVPERMLVHVVCEEKDWTDTAEMLREKGKEFFPDAERSKTSATVPCQTDDSRYRIEAGREAWTTAGMVNYAARFGNFKAHGYEYTGALAVLRVLLSYDYLWNHIRVLGGAYGCSAVFGSTGNSGFSSYRDPNLTETEKIYEGIPEYAEKFDADEREMTKAVIGAIGELDTPLTPLGKGLRDLSAYLSHVSDEMRQKHRNEIIDAVPQDIRNLRELLQSLLDDGYECALAGAGKARDSADHWTGIQPLVSDGDGYTG